jgi:heme exporter protein A
VPASLRPPGCVRTGGLELEGITRRYGEREALGDVTLSLPEGATLVVFGANGAGKTTLLRVLATLLRPHGGRARVLGVPLPEESWALRGRIGLLGHEPLLYRQLTASENLRYHAALHGVAGERVAEVLEAVAIPGRHQEPLRNLSRGMVQRVAIARAVLHEPELLLLDEPFSGLDIGAVMMLSATLRQVHARGTTLLMTTHDVERGFEVCTRAVILRRGRLVWDGSVAGPQRGEFERRYFAATQTTDVPAA